MLVAVVGNISGKIEPGAKGRIFSGILGLVFIVTGLSMHFTPKATDTRAFPTEVPEQKKLDQVIEAPRKPTTREVEVSSNVSSNAPASVSSIEEQEPNEHSHSATPIGLGSTIRGRLATAQDRDMFKFHTATRPASKIRVILRKSSAEGFYATLTVYDAAEQTIIEGSKGSDTPVSLGFESIPNSDYYVAVKPWDNFPWGNYRGDYELTVRVEE